MTHIPFATNFVEPAGSPIRELFPYLSRPGMISLAGGYPSPSLFDTEGLQEAAARALSGPGALQYGATEGLPALREALALLCGARGITCSPADLIVTTGSQQAFDLLLRIFIAPGDTVCVETPAYPAAIQALRLADAQILSAPVDEQGLDVEALAERLQRLPVAQRPKLLYTVPSFSNPCGTLLPAARREALVRLALEYGFLIVEDDPYGELAFTDERPASLYAVGQRIAAEANPVLYLSSLSKTVAPGLRIGWMIAPADVLRRCVVAKQTMDLCTSPLAQQIAAEYLGAGRYPAGVERACAEYKKRMLALSSGLRAGLGSNIAFVQPQGGMFIWARVAVPVDAKRLFEAAVQCGVLYVPGAAFYPENPDLGTLRLSYAAPDVEQIREGVARLTKAFDQASTS
ncbi:DNA-binding transcriptional regulator, MocR family, contains an aminotransferase domain [Polaromonas sp. OV174]|uniref:aminotransferase-like domain-containing protein n=1 Tax=Polaromonas sp. OV174 TaxID=1855300 RepID=UPI0008F44007|nr:PLP-dependent aminotransferase family protein [Polaromonas sp. OV174]SFB77684.1 DNA-binding transcriptional regulator, MocR family, contains an aminotransferase domain [Polaromonas sp. OV174]